MYDAESISWYLWYCYWEEKLSAIVKCVAKKTNLIKTKKFLCSLNKKNFDWEFSRGLRFISGSLDCGNLIRYWRTIITQRRALLCNHRSSINVMIYINVKKLYHFFLLHKSHICKSYKQYFFTTLSLIEKKFIIVKTIMFIAKLMGHNCQ